MELIYVAVGDIKVQIPGKIFHLKQGDSIFINSNILHYAEAEPFCEIHSIVFHPNLITGNYNSVYAKKYITPLSHCSGLDGYQFTSIVDAQKNVISDIITAFQAILTEESGYEFVVRERLSKICLFLYHCFKTDIEMGNSDLNPDTLRIRKMLDFIHEHYSEHLELPQIAKAADIGERECLRCFQRIIKVSPMQYLIKYRVTKGASLLLRNREFSIADISMQCGFDSPSNFSQMFKRFFRCSPREYRNHS